MAKPAITVLRGAELTTALPALAELRIQVFRDWPYLYQGTAEYERAYLAGYAACPRSVVAVVTHEGQVVGASTGLPLADADVALRQPFQDAGLDVDAVFYCGESVLLPAYRGLGLGHAFFDLREDEARAQGKTKTAFCAVLRADSDPRRPADARALDGFWTKRGYQRRADLVASFDWTEVGASAQTAHPMGFWLKDL